MISPIFLDGAPNWVDLGTPDLDGATGFYRELFGWGLIPGGPEVGGYGMLTLDGRYVGGVMTVPEEQAPSAWSVSFQSPDVAATAAAVQRAGGSAVFEPMDVLDFGSMGGFTDPAGAYFGVWQPKDHRLRRDPGARLVPLGRALHPRRPCGGRLLHQRVRLGHRRAEGRGHRLHLHHGPPGRGGRGRVVRRSGQDGRRPHRGRAGPHWLPYFAVADVAATVAEARRLGGTETLAAMEVPGVGTMANVADPYGAVFAVMRPEPRQ